MAARETGESLEGRIKHQFPALFITLVSVLIGLVLADLVAEARARMTLWPLNLATLRTWGQVTAQGSSAMTAWVIYSHIGISQQRIPLLADSFIAFVVPLTLLLATSLIGREQIWPWFYYAGGSLAVSLATIVWLLHLSRSEAELAVLSGLLRTRGLFLIFYTGVPSFALAGWLDQQKLLSPLGEVIFAAIPLPSAVLAAHLFLRDWRRAIANGGAR